MRDLGAAAYTSALHTGLWAIAAVSVLGAIMVGLLARERRAGAGEPDASDPAPAGQVA